MSKKLNGGGPGVWLLNLLSSSGLACVLLIFLLYLTWAGTLAQVDTTLFQAQKRYFESFYLVEWLGPLPVPLPGGQLVLYLLGVNLILGGIVRVRWTLGNIGILIAHVGIVLLLVAGFVRYMYAVEGTYRAFEGESRSDFVSRSDWEVAIGEPLAGGQVKEFSVPGDWFIRLEGSEKAELTSPELPFDLTLSRFMENARPRQVKDGAMPPEQVVDGFWLEEIDPFTDDQPDCPGLFMEARDRKSGQTIPGLLWANMRLLDDYQVPLTLTVSGRPFTVQLRRKLIPLGFDLKLEKFTMSEHPGTMMARDYRSRVTAADGGLEQTVEIKMNEPLRYGDYILYQSSYGPQPPIPNMPMFTVLSVASNPSDQWPLWSCVVIAIGLVLHYVMKLLKYTRSQQVRLS
ncbi:MAG: cytochrome c biogenesis protein ResB [Planctomycetota bacterium]